MPQENLWATRDVPTSLVVELRADEAAGDVGEMIVLVLGRRGSILHKYTATFQGVGMDYVPDAFKACAEAYLWGELPQHLRRALKRMRDNAKAHQLAHERRPPPAV